MSLPTPLLGGPYRTVFDVGAFQGDFAHACLAAWHHAQVHSFEPLLPAPKAQRNYRRRWHWHEAALGPEEGTATINVCEFVPSSSFLTMTDLHKDTYPYTRQNEPLEVPVATIAEYTENISGPALLKIDVQGYELEVLKGAGPALHEFDAIALEVSHAELYEGGATAEDVDAWMEARGYRHVRRLDEMRHPDTDALLQSDELYQQWR